MFSQIEPEIIKTNGLTRHEKKLAAQKQAEYLDSQKVTNSVTIHQINEKKAVGCEA